MKKSFCISAIVVFSAIVAGSVQAALLGVHVIPPIISYSNAGSLSLNYNAVSQIFTVTTTPSTINFAVTEPTFSVVTPHSMKINIQVDNTGALVGSVGPGPDLVISGRVQRIVGTVTNVYSGLLLTGQITAFGYLYTGTTVDSYDFRFTPTGGLLESFYQCDHIGVALASEGSTFTGFFITNFHGQSKGNVGLEDTIPPSITCPFDSTATNVECSVAGGQAWRVRHVPESDRHRQLHHQSPGHLLADQRQLLCPGAGHQHDELHGFLHGARRLRQHQFLLFHHHRRGRSAAGLQRQSVH